jgi:lipopolysaccharide biosynthesis regulator YciM
MTHKFLITAASVGFLLGAAQGALAADAPKAPKLTHGVAVALTDAQKSIATKDYPTALAAIEKAKAVSSPTPYDTLMINRFAMGIHVGMGDLVAADVDAETAADTDPSAIPDTDKAAVYKPALQLAVNAKHMDKAVKYAKLFLATTPPPTGADQALATMALYQGGDYAGATATAQKNIDTATAAGQKPAVSDLQIIMNAQVKQNDQAGAEKTLETLVANYGQPQDWNQIMAVALTTKGMRDIDYIYMGRLMFLQGGTVTPTDASLVGSTSSRLGFLGDAVEAQKHGAAGFPPADAKADADKKTIPAQIAAGPKQNGLYNVKLAQALYGYGMYPEAIAAAQLGKSKGGDPDATEADMVIGMAEAAAGQYAAAVTSFAGIQATNPASARVVRLWGYFAKSKASPATAVAK